MNTAPTEAPENLVDIKHLHRTKFDQLYHRNVEFFNNMIENKIQAFVIGDTNFGCFVASKVETTIIDLMSEAETVCEFQFFEFKHILDHGVQKITPIKIYDFSDILEICDSKYLDGLLFHLNEIKEEHKNE